jgi:transcription initiation factor TFIIE subunit alpha
MKTYTDLEADQLIDMVTGEFNCSYCGAVVEEDMSVLPKADSRMVLAKFNDQIAPLYLLLKEVEDIILPNDILEPEVMDSPHMKSDITATHSAIGGAARGQINPKNIEYDTEMLAGNRFSVKIEANANESIASSEQARIQESVQEESARVKKEQPAWLKGSTVFDDNSSAVIIKKEKENTSINFSSQVAEDSVGSSKEILDVLLLHEKAQESSKSALSFLNTNAYGMDESPDNFEPASIPNAEDGEDEIMDSDEDEEEGARSTVRVDMQDIPLIDITDEHIEKMSPAEKQYYIKLTQEMYSHMYEI